MGPRRFRPLPRRALASIFGIAWLAACFAETPTIEGNDSGSADTGASSDESGGQCAADMIPTGLAACPAACTGGCDNDNVCQILCDGEASCAETTLVCPPEYECDIVCTGTDACDTVIVSCPPAFPCSLTCDGEDACGDLTMTCGAGECAVTCGLNARSCTGTIVDCSTGPCLAECSGESRPVQEDCDEACNCGECA